MNRALAQEWQYARLWAPLSTVTIGTAHTARAGGLSPDVTHSRLNNVLAHNTWEMLWEKYPLSSMEGVVE